MAAREITVVKQKYQTGDGTDLFLSNKIKVEADANGKYVPGSAVTTLSLHDTGGNIFGDSKPVATRGADGNWVFVKDGNGNPVAGLDLQKSLANRNSMLNVNLNNHIKQSMGAPLQGVPAGQVNNNTPQAVAAATGIGTNTAGVGSTSGGSAPAGPPESGNVREGTKTDSFGDFVYPEGIRSSKQDVIKFTMLKYKPSGVGATQSAGKSDRGSTVGGNFKERTILGSVVLPIPNNISDTNSMDWGSNPMNALEAGLAAAAFTGITEGIGKGVETLGAGFQAGADDPATKRAIGAAFAGAAVGGNSAAILSRAEGTVINPNLELLFNGPQLRPFNFTFKLAARSKKESEQIIKILNFFKRGSSAIRTESNLFLKAPHTFGIQYLHLGQGGNDHPFIGRIKECALQSITTNYTPEGQYATFNDGVMVSYQITMQFSELEPIFNDDYNELTGIGY